MGTRSLTKVINKDTNEIITQIFQQFDGGIDDLGIFLCEFIKQSTSFNNTLYYNIGNFAARLVYELFNRSSYTRIVTEDDSLQQFTYEIQIGYKEINFICLEYDTILFSGNPKDFFEFVRKSNGKVIEDTDNIGLSV